jgi:hypothetical protein
LKKPTSLVWFRFYKPKTKKTEPNQNWKNNRAKPKTRAKTEKTEPNQKNRAKPV